jgi:hypothetical protein
MKYLTPLKAFRRFCVHSCALGSYKVIRECSTDDCPLYHFRFGHNRRRKANPSNMPTLSRNGDSGKFLPSQHGSKTILQTVTDREKRIRVIVEGME